MHWVRSSFRSLESSTQNRTNPAPARRQRAVAPRRMLGDSPTTPNRSFLRTGYTARSHGFVVEEFRPVFLRGRRGNICYCRRMGPFQRSVNLGIIQAHRLYQVAQPDKWDKERQIRTDLCPHSIYHRLNIDLHFLR
ncbi:unnamed protein product [Pseudo-nitzschia multistriata]|uniref:Uncharacterized protein n=1 Tax=Pseudo-nitzschia multistriata TaxID=183589 RepID=A0A448Z5T0_9STRA|nr:unnamed protein product [Pseudo-nitzschia multistriata]